MNLALSPFLRELSDCCVECKSRRKIVVLLYMRTYQKYQFKMELIGRLYYLYILQYMCYIQRTLSKHKKNAHGTLSLYLPLATTKRTQKTSSVVQVCNEMVVVSIKHMCVFLYGCSVSRSVL